MSTLLYISCRCAVSVSCCCVLMHGVHAQTNFGMIFFVITLCHILRLKCIKFSPDPAGGAYICSVPPDHLDLSGSTSKGTEGKERERRGTDVERKGRDEEAREGKSVMEGDERTPRV